MSGPRPSESRCFNENSPRPPVPGEERGGYQGRCQSSSSQQQPDATSLQPRQPSCDANDHQQHPSSIASKNSAAPLGYQPEGRGCCYEDEADEANTIDEDKLLGMEVAERRSSELAGSPGGPSSSLACLQWTRSLRALLEDRKGVQLFTAYLKQEGHSYALTFWFACEGLKEECDLEKLSPIYKALVRKFFYKNTKLALLPEELRKEVTRRFREGNADKRLFEQAQQEVERLLEETAYQNFLRSDYYLQYVRYCQSLERTAGGAKERRDEDEAETVGPTASGLDNECPSSPDEPSISCASSLLPTLHEDSEFSSQHIQHTHSQQQPSHHQHHHPVTTTTTMTTTGGSSAGLPVTAATAPASDYGKGEMRLTKDMLMATQQLRALDVRPKPEAFAGSDSASMAKRSSARKQYARQYQAMKRSAMMNRDPEAHGSTIIPRTQRLTREQTQPMSPELFARQLIEKLMLVQRDRENEEKLERKLREVDLSSAHGDSLCESSSLSVSMVGQPQVTAPCNLPSRNLADALREKLQLEEDSDQAILDQHVSRVWSDLTPSRSPKLSSPRPRSPDKCRRQQLLQQQQQQQMLTVGQIPLQQQSLQQPHHHHHQQQQQQPITMSAPAPRTPAYRSQRKEKDVFSTFSGDSGNVHDFPEAGELHAAGSMSSLGSHHLPKSKSVPSDYADSLHKQDLYLQGQDPRYRRLDAARSSATKKSMTELTDSGVSVVSDVQDTRLLNWVKETVGAGTGCKSDAALASGGSIAVSAKPSSSRKKFSNAPQQPFVGDPGMPLLPRPHTPTQLEEASRRLEYEKFEQNRSRQRYPGASGVGAKQQLPPDYELMQPSMQCYMQSSQSTLRRTRQDAPSEFTTVVFSFCDEKVPYRTKIPGHNVTLKQFKDVLPKKGSYRYFFKTECEDLDMRVIQEEITDDGEELPLWEGKVMAQVKALE